MAVVGFHHGGTLLVAHGIHAAVGQYVQANVTRAIVRALVG